MINIKLFSICICFFLIGLINYQLIGQPMENTILIKVGGKSFVATLLDSPSANAFRALLPITMTMTELNRNEKYVRLSKSLPVQSSNPETIQTGDLMLWGTDTIVLFYESFTTTYRYTRLGKINKPDGLANALGKGNVTVTFLAN